MLTLEQSRMEMTPDKRVVKPSVTEVKGQVSSECDSWEGQLITSLITMWEIMNPTWCPKTNAGFVWDVTADVVLK